MVLLSFSSANSDIIHLTRFKPPVAGLNSNIIYFTRFKPPVAG